MTFYAALDVSLEKTTVCVMGHDGSIVREIEVATCPEALAHCLGEIAPTFELVGLEAGPMSEWLVRGLAEHGLAAVLMETRQVRAALSSMRTKTDRNDARGMAHLLRMGWFRPVHLKATDTREHRTRLAARDALVRRVRDLENSMRGLLRGFGLRVPPKTRGGWDRAIRGLVEGHLGLTGIFEPLLLARTALREQLAVLDKQVREAARTDPICKRLMTAPGVGAIVALTFRCAVDDPSRFTSSRSTALWATLSRCP